MNAVDAGHIDRRIQELPSAPQRMVRFTLAQPKAQGYHVSFRCFERLSLHQMKSQPDLWQRVSRVKLEGRRRTTPSIFSSLVLCSSSWPSWPRSSMTLVTVASFILGLFATNVLNRWSLARTIYPSSSIPLPLSPVAPPSCHHPCPSLL